MDNEIPTQLSGLPGRQISFKMLSNIFCACNAHERSTPFYLHISYATSNSLFNKNIPGMHL
jgi:hypothetical protein